MITKAQLAIQLSHLHGFKEPRLKLEQYTTEPEIVATVLWDAFMKGDIANKIIADLGAGTGILGIGALLLGAKMVYFVEKEKNVVAILKKNLENIKGSWLIVVEDINLFDKKVDIVFQNPPFGTKQRHADKSFLEKAFSVADVVYSFHKTATEVFVRSIADDYTFNVVETFKFLFPLRQTFPHQRKKRELIEVTCYRMVKR